MTLRLFLILIISSILFLSCSGNKKSFKGDWFAIEHYKVGQTHWRISEDNIVEIYQLHNNSFEKYELIRNDSSQYYLLPKQSEDPIELGTISSFKKDTIQFSNKPFSSELKLVRLTRKTNSPYSQQEYSEILSNSILDLKSSQKDIRAKLYLSDSLNVYGYRSLDLVQNLSLGDHSEIATSWAFESFLGNYIFSYLISTEIFTLLISEADKDSLSGTLFVFGEGIPVKGNISDYPSNQEYESLEAILTETNLKTKSTSLFEQETNQEHVVSMEWAPSYINNTIHIDSVRNNPITFDFKKDKTLQTYKYGKPEVKYNWKISKDGKYVFIYNRSDRFAKLSTLKNNPSQLTLNLGFEVGSPEDGVVSETVVFELEAR